LSFADQCDRYIAKTLYGDDEKEETPQSSSVDEPKLLGVHPTSNEKVFLKKLALCIRVLLPLTSAIGMP
jgi:hypothetical protein